MSAFDCICVGLNTVDVIARVPGWLREDEKIRAERIVVDGGGPAGTCACVLGRSGLKTGLLSFIGDDPLAGFVLKQFSEYRVSPRFLIRVPGAANPVSMILVNAKNASRTIVWNPQGITDRKVSFAKLSRMGIFDTRSLHFDGHLMALSISLARAARKKKIFTSYDCGTLRKGWETLASLSDVFIASHKFARQLGLAVPRAVRWLRDKFGFQAAVTDGEKGFHYFDEASREVRFAAQRRYRAMDTTGCGDVFHGAFLAAYLRGSSFADSLVFAQRVAGEKAVHMGGRAGIPARAIVTQAAISAAPTQRRRSP